VSKDIKLKVLLPARSALQVGDVSLSSTLENMTAAALIFNFT